MKIQKPPMIRVGKSNAKDKFHDMRFHYCYYLLIKELRSVDDKKTKEILDKYSAQYYDKGWASLRFPVSLRESTLPEYIQSKNEPGEEQL